MKEQEQDLASPEEGQEVTMGEAVMHNAIGIMRLVEELNQLRALVAALIVAEDRGDAYLNVLSTMTIDEAISEAALVLKALQAEAGDGEAPMQD